MATFGAVQLKVLTGEARLKHVNTIMSAFFSVHVFRHQLMGLGADTAVPTQSANQSFW